MAMDIATPQNDERHEPLDSPPPLPAKLGRKATLMDMAGDGSGGLGQLAGNPQVMALQFMSMIQKGAQGLAQFYPTLDPLMAQILGVVNQAVPQALTGGNPMQVPAAAPPAGGGPPMPMASPPPPPMMAGGPAGM